MNPWFAGVIGFTLGMIYMVLLTAFMIGSRDAPETAQEVSGDEK